MIKAILTILEGSIPYAPLGHSQKVIGRIKAERETREAKQRRLYCEREAERTGDAQRKRYVNHILVVMPIMNGMQRMPCYSEFAQRLNEAYQTISHEWQGYATGNTDWMQAVEEVRGILARNQINVVENYARCMRKAMHSGSNNLKAIWQEIAHYTDKDDVNLKHAIWKVLCLPYSKLF